ncbi:2-keto-4-pentenoate hydratase [Nonomuraea guangzhouensis]|uniref:2-keto-4-pentenoate hydratase n=1 Tax=Nonomuraea guangzhouensis TaxID=1291555 RepID=A0ABW4GEM6_9ACTN|nr:fumarylacetoacetate hydrolase family protein [Nonomuraea guangzhouensis]
MDFDSDELAARIVRARAERRPLRPLTDEGTLSMEQAYAVQEGVTRLRLASGQRIIGWKLGYTSLAMREQMGVSEMNAGPLTDAMSLHDGATVPATLLQPLVEPEIALILGRTMPVNAGLADVLAATERAYACLEVVDPIWQDRRFRIEDNTADGSSAAGFVLGAPLDLADLPSIAVTMSHNGEITGHATGAAAGGHPAAGVAWLAGLLAGRGEALRPGDIVLTGGLTRAIPLEPGDEIAATFDEGARAVRVSVRR